MSPIDATVRLMENWAVLGLLNGLTPDELIAKTTALLALFETASKPKPKAKAKPKAEPKAEPDPEEEGW